MGSWEGGGGWPPGGRGKAQAETRAGGGGKALVSPSRRGPPVGGGGGKKKKKKKKSQILCGVLEKGWCAAHRLEAGRPRLRHSQGAMRTERIAGSSLCITAQNHSPRSQPIPVYSHVAQATTVA